MRSEAVGSTEAGRAFAERGRNGASAAPRVRGGASGGENATEIQRDRMIAAAIEVVEALGYQRLTVSQIVARSRVSRKTFYEVFRDCEDCFCAAFDHAVADAMVHLRGAFATGTDWQSSVRGALAELLRLMEERPGLARLCLVEALGASEAALRRRAHILGELAAIIERGFTGEGSTGPDVHPLVAHAVVGGVTALVHERIVSEPRGSLIDLLGPSMFVLVAPYRGRAEAEKQLAIARREARRRSPRPMQRPKRPPATLQVRLTYRTLRVLSVIARAPAASNREIAADAGVTDQGQISKLLRRLSDIGLVENRGEGQARGGANAWHLTRLGAQVLGAAHPEHSADAIPHEVGD